MKAFVSLVACVLFAGCRPNPPSVDLSPLQIQLAELQGCVKALSLKESSPQPESLPFQISAYRYANVEGVVMLNRATGETWLLIKGNTNHPAGWVPMVILERVAKDEPSPPPPDFELSR